MSYSCDNWVFCELWWWCRLTDVIFWFLAWHFTRCIRILCVCGLKEKVRRPHSSKLVHCIDAVRPLATTQITVPLMLSHNESHRSSPVQSNHIVHSVSSPMLQGAWSMRNLEHAVPPLDTSRHTGTLQLWRLPHCYSPWPAAIFSISFKCCLNVLFVISSLSSKTICK